MYIKPDIRIAIAEDHELFREGLISRLKKQENLNILGDFENGKELLEFLEIQEVDIVLMDVQMPVLDGVKATKEIIERFPDIKIIALTMYDNDSVIIDMLAAGAMGYLLKNTSFNEMLDVIHKVFEGNKSYAKVIFNKIMDLAVHKKFYPHQNAKHADLTDTELGVIRLMSHGYSAREIGEILKLSDRAVEGYKSKLLNKFDVKNAIGVVIMALKNNLISLEDCG